MEADLVESEDAVSSGDRNLGDRRAGFGLDERLGDLMERVQLVLTSLSVRDIASNTNKLVRSIDLVVDAFGGVVNPADLTVGPNDPILNVDPVVCDPVERGPDPIVVLVVDRVKEPIGLVVQLCFRPIPDGFLRLAHESKVVVIARTDPDHLVEIFCQQFEPLGLPAQRLSVFAFGRHVTNDPTEQGLACRPIELGRGVSDRHGRASRGLESSLDVDRRTIHGCVKP